MDNEIFNKKMRIITNSSNEEISNLMDKIDILNEMKSKIFLLASIKASIKDTKNNLYGIKDIKRNKYTYALVYLIKKSFGSNWVDSATRLIHEYNILTHFNNNDMHILYALDNLYENTDYVIKSVWNRRVYNRITEIYHFTSIFEYTISSKFPLCDINHYRNILNDILIIHTNAVYSDEEKSIQESI